MKRYSHFVIAFFLLLFGLSGISLFYYSQEKSELKNQKLELINAHNRAITVFTNSIEKCAAVVAGIQAYANYNDNFPTADLLQQFINLQLSSINYKSPIVVSFLDTTHTFQYSFNRDYIDPGLLTGLKLNLLRNEEELNRLNKLMMSDSIRMFYPMNLVEGWLGIPINVRVHRKNGTIGYLAPIFDLKTIIQPIYEEQGLSDYIFSFSTIKGDFDRELSHDGSKIYNQTKDPKYYKNFQVANERFYFSDVTLYGNNIRIGTAKLHQEKASVFSERILYGWLISYTILVFLITWQVYRYKKLNVSLNELNYTKNKFFAIIGHDLKGPINSLSSFSSLLINHAKSLSTEEIQELAKDLDKSLKNLYALLENLLQWSRSQTGNISFKKEAFDLNAVISDNISLLDQQAKNKKISVIYKHNKPITVKGHLDSISTVVRNLLSNALKFTDVGGEVFIRIIEGESHFTVQVVDNGVGVSKGQLDKIFRIDVSNSTKGTAKEKGTGLGLILCKDFVEKNGGEIFVESTEDEGSVFSFTVPR